MDKPTISFRQGTIKHVPSPNSQNHTPSLKSFSDPNINSGILTPREDAVFSPASEIQGDSNYKNLIGVQCEGSNAVQNDAQGFVDQLEMGVDGSMLSEQHLAEPSDEIRAQQNPCNVSPEFGLNLNLIQELEQLKNTGNDTNEQIQFINKQHINSQEIIKGDIEKIHKVRYTNLQQKLNQIKQKRKQQDESRSSSYTLSPRILSKDVSGEKLQESMENRLDTSCQWTELVHSQRDPNYEQLEQEDFQCSPSQPSDRQNSKIQGHQEVYIDQTGASDNANQVNLQYSEPCTKENIQICDLYKITEEDGSVSQISNSVFLNSGRFNNHVDQIMMKRQQSISQKSNNEGNHAEKGSKQFGEGMQSQNSQNVKQHLLLNEKSNGNLKVQNDKQMHQFKHENAKQSEFGSSNDQSSQNVIRKLNVQEQNKHDPSSVTNEAIISDLSTKTPPRPVLNEKQLRISQYSPSVGDIDRRQFSPEIATKVNFDPQSLNLGSSNLRGSYDNMSINQIIPNSLCKSSFGSKQDFTYDEFSVDINNHRNSVSSTQYQDLLKEHKHFMLHNQDATQQSQTHYQINQMPMHHQLSQKLIHKKRGSLIGLLSSNKLSNQKNITAQNQQMNINEFKSEDDLLSNMSRLSQMLPNYEQFDAEESNRESLRHKNSSGQNHLAQQVSIMQSQLINMQYQLMQKDKEVELLKKHILPGSILETNEQSSDLIESNNGLDQKAASLEHFKQSPDQLEMRRQGDDPYLRANLTSQKTSKQKYISEDVIYEENELDHTKSDNQEFLTTEKSDNNKALDQMKLQHDLEILEIKRELTKSVLSRGSTSQYNQINDQSDEIIDNSYRDHNLSSKEHSDSALASPKKLTNEEFDCKTPLKKAIVGNHEILNSLSEQRNTPNNQNKQSNARQQDNSTTTIPLSVVQTQQRADWRCQVPTLFELDSSVGRRSKITNKKHQLDSMDDFDEEIIFKEDEIELKKSQLAIKQEDEFLNELRQKGIKDFNGDTHAQEVELRECATTNDNRYNEDYVQQSDKQFIVFNDNMTQEVIDQLGQGIAQNNKSYNDYDENAPGNVTANYSDIEIQKVRSLRELENHSIKKESQQNSIRMANVNDTSYGGWQNPPQGFQQYLPSPSPLKLEDQRKMQSQSVPQSAQVPRGKSKQHKRQKTSYNEDKRPNHAFTQLLKPDNSSESQKLTLIVAQEQDDLRYKKNRINSNVKSMQQKAEKKKRRDLSSNRKSNQDTVKITNSDEQETQIAYGIQGLKQNMQRSQYSNSYTEITDNSFLESPKVNNMNNFEKIKYYRIRNAELKKQINKSNEESTEQTEKIGKLKQLFHKKVDQLETQKDEIEKSENEIRNLKNTIDHKQVFIDAKVIEFEEVSNLNSQLLKKGKVTSGLDIQNKSTQIRQREFSKDAKCQVQLNRNIDYDNYQKYQNAAMQNKYQNQMTLESTPNFSPFVYMQPNMTSTGPYTFKSNAATTQLMKHKFPRNKNEIDKDFAQMSQKIDELINDDFDVLKQIIVQDEKRAANKSLYDQFQINLNNDYNQKRKENISNLANQSQQSISSSEEEVQDFKCSKLNQLYQKVKKYEKMEKQLEQDVKFDSQYIKNLRQSNGLSLRNYQSQQHLNNQRLQVHQYNEQFFMRNKEIQEFQKLNEQENLQLKQNKQKPPIMRKSNQQSSAHSRSRSLNRKNSHKTQKTKRQDETEYDSMTHKMPQHQSSPAEDNAEYLSKNKASYNHNKTHEQPMHQYSQEFIVNQHHSSEQAATNSLDDIIYQSVRRILQPDIVDDIQNEIQLKQVMQQDQAQPYCQNQRQEFSSNPISSNTQNMRSCTPSQYDQLYTMQEENYGILQNCFTQQTPLAQDIIWNTDQDVLGRVTEPQFPGTQNTSFIQELAENVASCYTDQVVGHLPPALQNLNSIDNKVHQSIVNTILHLGALNANTDGVQRQIEQVCQIQNQYQEAPMQDAQPSKPKTKRNQNTKKHKSKKVSPSRACRVKQKAQNQTSDDHNQARNLLTDHSLENQMQNKSLRQEQKEQISEYNRHLNRTIGKFENEQGYQLEMDPSTQSISIFDQQQQTYIHQPHQNQHYNSQNSTFRNQNQNLLVNLDQTLNSPSLSPIQSPIDTGHHFQGQTATANFFQDPVKMPELDQRAARAYQTEMNYRPREHPQDQDDTQIKSEEFNMKQALRRPVKKLEHIKPLYIKRPKARKTSALRIKKAKRQFSPQRVHVDYQGDYATNFNQGSSNLNRSSSSCWFIPSADQSKQNIARTSNTTQEYRTKKQNKVGHKFQVDSNLQTCDEVTNAGDSVNLLTLEQQSRSCRNGVAWQIYLR